MTRKDYELIAKVICDSRQSYGKNWDSNLFRALDDVAQNMAKALKADNPNFDSKKFFIACNGGV